ncbi:hypothetical protein OBBRIDRAFT_656280 [Obba rivulosa]|uniref:C3H1-type domain-containing protein n=1 Tax=Obba rivulosa TaxID=1052685 RepID=A0A8E2ARG0_9APHY|nr:hypothetical protein OBBRIDRAFT_656280 [Obba rivulosa]
MYSSRGRTRTKLCRNYALGYCPQGSQCNYIHASPPTSIASLSTPTSRLQMMLPNPGGQSAVPSLMSAANMWPAASGSGTEISAHNAGSTKTSPSGPMRPLSWRTTLCRHFVKNNGQCPLGDDCGYIHDLHLANSALQDVRFHNPRETLGTRVASTSRPGGDKSKAGTKHSHCWAYIQGLCHFVDCPYLHPVNVDLFVPHTPCLAWPNCPRGPLCRFKHPEPIIPKVAWLPQPSLGPIGNIPALSQSNLSSSPFLNVLPPLTSGTAESPMSGAFQFQGTTYFPVLSQLAPAPPPVIAPLAPRITLPSFNTAFDWQPQYNAEPIVEPQLLGSIPTSPMYEYISTQDPVQAPMPSSSISLQDAALRALAGPSQLNTTRHPLPPAGPNRPDFPDHEFPYVPPTEQRVGHTRRISVAVESREESDVHAASRPRSRRPPWQAHLAHKSWAAATSDKPNASSSAQQLLFQT